MNDWYIDRSKNFVNEHFDEILFSISKLERTPLSGADLINKLNDTGLLGKGNPNAALTRLRDHGLLSKDNVIGDSALDYCEGRLNKGDLIIDLFLKRAAAKKNSPNIKPLVLICKVFDIMFDTNTDPDDIFLTASECKEYLYPCTSYDDITYELVSSIIDGRKYDENQVYVPRITLLDNEETNISIWFNALKETPIFMPKSGDARLVLQPNQRQKEFFRFIAVNADEFTETPTTSNESQYDYYCDRTTGLLEVVPKVIIPTATIRNQEDICILYEYLFGYKKHSGFDYLSYVKYDCFGIFFPFITVPKLVIRQVYLSNKEVGQDLYDFISTEKGYAKLFDEGKFEYQGYYFKDNESIPKEQTFNYGKRIDDKSFPVLNKKKNKKYPFNCILYGAPGTGKTYATAKYALAIIEDKTLEDLERENRDAMMQRYNSLLSSGQIVFTTFHQSYGYEDFIQGLRPVTNSENLVFNVVDGVFKSIADKAMHDAGKEYVIIIDEINRANISKVFGELITLIEGDKRWGEENALSVKLPSGDLFAVPNNLYIIGTMNSADKSISLLDTALRRRFEFVEFVPELRLIDDPTLKAVLKKLNEGIVEDLNTTDLLVGHSFFINKNKDDVCEIMNHSILPLLYEYYFDNGKKVEAQVKNALDGVDVEVEHNPMGRISVRKK